MAEAHIVAAGRTAGGHGNGQPVGWHPIDPGAATLNSGIGPDTIEKVVVNCGGSPI